MARVLATAIAALALAPAAAAQAPTVTPDAAAMVGATPITIATFNRWMTIAASSEAEKVVEPPDPPEYTRCKATKRGTDRERMRACSREWGALRDQVLQFLISGAWIEAEAGVQGVTVTDEQVQREFERTRDENFETQREFDEFLAESGMTMDDLLFRVRLNALSDELRERAVAGVAKPTPAQRRAYYRKHKRRFRRPRLHQAVVIEKRTRRAAERALAAVRAGRSWRGQGGVARAAEDVPFLPRLAKAIRQAPRGVPIGPVKSRNRWYVFELRRVRPPHQQTFAQARRTVRRLLVSQAQQRALDRFVREFQARWRAETTCRKPYVVDDCGTIVD